MKSRSLLLLAGLVGSASLAHAQTFQTPHFFVWSNSRPTAAIPALNPQAMDRLTDLTCMIHTSVINGDNLSGPPFSPQQVAQKVADKIHAAVADGQTEILSDPQHRLCITLHAFADDTEWCDPDGQLYGSPLTFFREEDRLPGLLDSQFPRPAGSQNELRSARAYRHPFLSNAVDSDAPLRQWMRSFCQAYLNLQSSQPYADLPSLDGCRFYFDSEPSITWAGNQPNCVFMLKKIAESPWWSTRQVPGYPAGTTLASLYSRMVNQPGSGFPANILDPVSGLDPNPFSDGTTARNRKFMLWYAGVCDRARDAVFKNCLYDAVHEYWPTAICLNYSDARLDNLPGSTGWFTDWANPNNPGNPGTRHTPSNVLPRGEIDRWTNGGPMYPTTAGRYTMVPRWTSGDKDSPVLYDIVGVEHLGENGLGWNSGTNDYCHQQPNLYMPPVANGCDGANKPPCETLLESTMRLSRHDVEASINSVTGFPGDPQTGGHENRLAPWLQMGFAESCNGTPQPERTVSDALARDLLAMLRAKNIREANYWVAFNPETSELGAQQAAVAWFVTGSVIQRVYATRIVDWSVLQGMTVVDPNIDVPDASSLEFTLLNSAGNPRTVTLHGTGLPGKLQSQLQVRVSVPAAYWNMPKIINVESTVNTTGHKGYMYAYDFVGSLTSNGLPGWVLVPQLGGQFAYDYAWSGDGKSSRIQCTLNGSLNFINTNTGSPDFGMMKLKLVAKGNTSSIVNYDLVQVIPYGDLFLCSLQGSIGGGGPAAIAVPQSDVNFDQAVTMDDLIDFLDLWEQGTPVADTNLDGEVTATDLLGYLETFSAEQ